MLMQCIGLSLTPSEASFLRCFCGLRILFVSVHRFTFKFDLTFIFWSDPTCPSQSTNSVYSNSHPSFKNTVFNSTVAAAAWAVIYGFSSSSNLTQPSLLHPFQDLLNRPANTYFITLSNPQPEARINYMAFILIRVPHL